MERIEEEKIVVAKMIRLYCRRFEGNAVLCDSCREVLEYATACLSRCKFGNEKPTCRKCEIHCYKPDMKKRIQEIMKWSGPRMMLHHPVDALRHLHRERLTHRHPAAKNL